MLNNDDSDKTLRLDSTFHVVGSGNACRRDKEEVVV